MYISLRLFFTGSDVLSGEKAATSGVDENTTIKWNETDIQRALLGTFEKVCLMNAFVKRCQCDALLCIICACMYYVCYIIDKCWNYQQSYNSFDKLSSEKWCRNCCFHIVCTRCVSLTNIIAAMPCVNYPTSTVWTNCTADKKRQQNY